MIASLMMYKRAELAGANDRYWRLIRQNLKLAGIDSPQHLAQDAEEFLVWKSPNLVLSQTCGMPYRLWLHEMAELVGTPDYGVAGCPPGYYRSAIIVRAGDPREKLDDFRDGIFAYNQIFSQSGYAAPYAHLRKCGFWFETRLHTGQHLESARAVAYGRADIAALDAVSWRLMDRYDAFAKDLRVLSWTKPTPGLPLITAQGNDAKAIFAAVKFAIDQLTAEDRQALGLQGIVNIPHYRYAAIPNPPEEPSSALTHRQRR